MCFCYLFISLFYLYLKLRSEGIRLLILWLQSLQNNMNISCEVMFACVVPGFPNPLDILDTSNIELPLHVLEEICSTVRGPEKDVSHASGSMTLLPQENKNLGKIAFKFVKYITYIWKQMTYHFVTETVTKRLEVWLQR